MDGAGPRRGDRLYTYGSPELMTEGSFTSGPRGRYDGLRPDHREELEWMDRLYDERRRRRAKRHGGTRTGAPRAGEDGDHDGAESG